MKVKLSLQKYPFVICFDIDLSKIFGSIISNTFKLKPNQIAIYQIQDSMNVTTKLIQVVFEFFFAI